MSALQKRTTIFYTKKMVQNLFMSINKSLRSSALLKNSKYDQNHSLYRIWSHLLKKSVMEIFIFFWSATFLDLDKVAVTISELIFCFWIEVWGRIVKSTYFARFKYFPRTLFQANCLEIAIIWESVQANNIVFPLKLKRYIVYSAIPQYCSE